MPPNGDNPLLSFLQLHLPAFRSPARLSSLYSSFTALRTLNPDGYAANSATWLSALTLLTRHGLLPSSTTGTTSRTTTTGGSSSSSSSSSRDTLILTSTPSLASSLSAPGLGLPLSLSAVIHDAVPRGDLLPLPTFETQERSIYAPQPWRGVPGPLDAVRWGMRALGLSGSSSGDDGGGSGTATSRFVVKSTLEEAGGRVERMLRALSPARTERVLSRAEFEGRFRACLAADGEGADLSDADMGVLLRFLCRDRAVLSYSGAVVKVVAPGGRVEEVTGEDEGIAKMKSLMGDLQAQVDELAEREGRLAREAREAVAQGQNVKAKRALRNKKAVVALLEQRGKMLETLEATWRSIEVASDNVAIVEAMREGRDVLKSLNAKVGGVEGVEDVMEGLREQMDATEDVTSVINEGAAAGIDMSEVDDELEVLEREEREKIEAKETAQRQAIEAKARSEQEAREKADHEAMRQRLAGLDVPVSAPGRAEEEDDDDHFEEANEMAH